MLSRVIALSLLVASPAFAVVPPLPVSNGLEVTVFDPQPREASCIGGRVLKVVEAAPFHPRTTPSPVEQIVVVADGPPPSQVNDANDEVLTFSVDAEGRPLDIRRAGTGRFFGDPDTAIAALAGWRFDAGAATAGCHVSIPTHRMPIALASRATLFEIFAFERGNTPASVRETLAKAGNCRTGPRRLPKTIAYPDLRRFNGRDLNPAWAAVTYDIDANGAPRNVRIDSQGGDPALADAVAAAAAESRFLPGKPVQACYGTFAADPRETPAPHRPKAAFALPEDQRPANHCPVTQAQLNLPAFKNYPRAYAARKVAGWAYLSFDVAPWGQIGNVQVLESQPSAAFGQAAQSLLWSARPKPPAEGYRGCILPVFYNIPEPDPIFD
jgi:TonB family protein